MAKRRSVDSCKKQQKKKKKKNQQLNFEICISSVLLIIFNLDIEYIKIEIY